MTQTFTDEYDFGRTGRTCDLPFGFTPIRNKRIEAAIASEGLKLLEAGRVRPENVQAEAIRAVASTLPSMPFARQLRLPRPSKNDCPIYRKQACGA